MREQAGATQTIYRRKSHGVTFVIFCLAEACLVPLIIFLFDGKKQHNNSKNLKRSSLPLVGNYLS